MKSHLKRINTPRTWLIARKQNKYITHPNGGSQKMMLGIPLSIAMRDYLGLCATSNETRKVLRTRHVLVNGTRRTDASHMIGLFDTLEISDLKKAWRLILTQTNRLKLIEIPAAEKNLTYSKIKNKTVLRGKKIQINLWDGRNIIVPTQQHTHYRTGDTIMLEVPTQHVKETIPMDKGHAIFLLEGKHAGRSGTLEAISGKKALFKDKDGQTYETLKEYVFAVGKGKSHLTIMEADA